MSAHGDNPMLFTGSQDKMIRAVILESGIIDRAFVASRESIRCLHIQDNLLFVAGNDPVIRAYDLETGAVKSYDGHQSWINCMTTYIITDAEGNVKKRWLISGSDDKTIKIWDIESRKLLETLKDLHKNGVTCLTVFNK